MCVCTTNYCNGQLQGTTYGQVCCIFGDAEFNLKKADLFSLDQNVAEKEIKEHKKGSCHVILATDRPRRLWEDFLELEDLIYLPRAYLLDCKIPKVYVAGETADISQLYQLEWYDKMYITQTLLNLLINHFI